MKILITGASGFIGRHVVKTATARGHNVVALIRNIDSTTHLDGVKWQKGDISDLSIFNGESFDGLIHLAAHGVNPSAASWEMCFQVNLTDSLKLWIAAKNAGCHHFVICGSCFEYGTSGEQFDFIPVSAPLQPTGPYHASKAAATLAASAFCVDMNVNVYIPRPFHVYGHGEDPNRFWPSLCAAALSGKDFPMTSGEQIRDFSPVQMVADKIVDGLTRTDLETGMPLIENLGSGQPKTLAEFAKEEWQRFGATGALNLGAIPQRKNEVMRFVPLIHPETTQKPFASEL